MKIKTIRKFLFLEKIYNFKNFLIIMQENNNYKRLLLLEKYA